MSKYAQGGRVISAGGPTDDRVTGIVRPCEYRIFPSAAGRSTRRLLDRLNGATTNISEEKS